jgi:beta-lactamase regulating signal transducer with metallopeptidase domain
MGQLQSGHQKDMDHLELIKKPQKLLEYVIVHELAHFIERRHNKRFKAIYVGLGEVPERFERVHIVIKTAHRTL